MILIDAILEICHQKYGNVRFVFTPIKLKVTVQTGARGGGVWSRCGSPSLEDIQGHVLCVEADPRRGNRPYLTEVWSCPRIMEKSNDSWSMICAGTSHTQ